MDIINEIKKIWERKRSNLVIEYDNDWRNNCKVGIPVLKDKDGNVYYTGDVLEIIYKNQYSSFNMIYQYPNRQDKAFLMGYKDTTKNILNDSDPDFTFKLVKSYKDLHVGYRCGSLRIIK